jgi:hypothetical protein
MTREAERALSLSGAIGGTTTIFDHFLLASELASYACAIASDSVSEAVLLEGDGCESWQIDP